MNDPSQGGQYKRVGFVSTRIAGTDGVSLEIAKWATVLERNGHECFYFAGLCDRPVERSLVVEEAYFGLPLLESALTRLPIVCSKIAPFTELAREDVCYFDLQDTPSQIATTMLSFAAGKPHRFFRRTKSSHLWDSIYRTGLVPLFQEVLEEQEAKVTVPA